MTSLIKPTCLMCNDTGYKDHASFCMEPCDHQANATRTSVYILGPATDWINQSVEQRLEECTAMLAIHGLLAQADAQRTLNRIRIRADFQREAKAGVTR